MPRKFASDLLEEAEWRCIATLPGEIANPTQLSGKTGWLAATVPGTVAGAIRESDGSAAARRVAADVNDWWFVSRVATAGEGPWLLQLQGLTAGAEVWVDDTVVLSSDSMFVPGEVVVTREVAKSSEFTLAIHFHSLANVLSSRRPRGRWRSSLVREQGLRWIRTTLLGSAPVFSGVPVPVGPWRGI